MIDRLLELEVLDAQGKQLTHTFHRAIVTPTDRGGLWIDFEPELPMIPAASTLRWTIQGQTFETTPGLWGIP